MAFHAFKDSFSPPVFTGRLLPRLLVWPAAAFAAAWGLGIGSGPAVPAGVAAVAFLLVAGAGFLPFRGDTAAAFECLSAGATVALTGGIQSPFLLLLPWLVVDYGVRGRVGIVVLVLVPVVYLAATGWAGTGVPPVRDTIVHGMVFLLAVLLGARTVSPGPAARSREGHAGFGARREDRLLKTALRLFSSLSEHEAGAGDARGTRALARVLPVFAEGDERTATSELTFRRFDARELLEDACRDWAPCASARGLDLQGFAVPSDRPVSFGDPHRVAYILDLMLFAGCFALESGAVTLTLELQEDRGETDLAILTLQATGRRQPALDTGIIRAALDTRADRLGGACFAVGSPPEGAWRVELPLDLEPGSGEPSRRLAGLALHVTGDSPLRAVLEAYLDAEGATLTDDPGRAGAIVLAEPARAPGTESRCQALRERWPRLPLLCQGATAGTPATLLVEVDAVIPVPFSRDALVRLIGQQLEPPEAPRGPPHGSAQATKEEASTDAGGVPGRDGGEVLVAEDDAISARVVSRFLEAEGCTVHRVRDGEAALESLERDEPVLALLDMHMPGLGGVEVAERFREWEKAQGRDPIPLVALTASAADEDRRACMDAGMDDFLNKPVDREALRALLERYSVVRAKA